MKKYHLLTLILLLLCPTVMRAQYETHVHTTSQGAAWDFPYAVDSLDNIEPRGNKITLYTQDGTEIPFDCDIDSLTFDTLATDSVKDRYQVFQMYITTNDGSSVNSNTVYTDAYFSLNGLGDYGNRSEAFSIRQRGNSSRLWYDKKPYRIKLSDKHKMLGLAKAKSWVLLANYRDVTDLMNTFVFECANWLGMPHTNHTRYVEVFLNGDYIGLYQLTEQIQQGKNRVDVNDNGGILLSLDSDDGPNLSPNADDNFWSKVYSMPTCMKYPEDVSLKDSVRTEFAKLESAIKAKDYTLIDSLLDVKSMIHYLMLQELVENVELVSPRSIYLYKDVDSKWVMGPMWDFDAGYDFDWGNMYTGHTYFAKYTELVMGSDPLNHTAGYDRNIPEFFTDLFGCKEFVQLYKDEWNAVSDSIITRNWAEMEKYLTHLRQGAITRDMARWPISGKSFETEVSKMEQWLTNRANYLATVINSYPTPKENTPTTSEKDCGTMSVTVNVSRSSGYSQFNDIEIDEDELCKLLGISSWSFSNSNAEFIPLNPDGSEGSNHTNGIYGGWFSASGTPGYWASGHVYIEIYDDFFNWSCGIHPDNCTRDSSHTVSMLLKYTDGDVVKKVTINVTFKIS